jgi:hypothetical protein
VHASAAGHVPSAVAVASYRLNDTRNDTVDRAPSRTCYPMREGAEISNARDDLVLKGVLAQAARVGAYEDLYVNAATVSVVTILVSANTSCSRSES